MKDLEVYYAGSAKEASALLKEKGDSSWPMGGGTDLIGVIREGILPQQINEIVSLKKAEDLQGITNDENYLTLGAATTLSEIEKNAEINQIFPALAEAARTVASPQIRHVATVGGNICQQVRCWYYRYQGDKFNCLRKGGERCNAVVGNNLYHSVFGAFKVCDPPCQVECPNSTNIPAYMERLRSGDIAGAAKILFEVNPLAAVTGRICPHTCEQTCNRKKFDESVSVREAERFLGDYVLEHPEDFITPPKKESGKKVTVIGSGPAGLSAAFYLRQAGHTVTILDQNPEIGGMLYYGIPSYRLPKEILARYKEILLGLGVNFRMNTKVGETVTLEDLYKECDIVLVGIGAWVSLGLEFEGKDAEGVLNALEFLQKAADRVPQKLGEKVVVIGGGNTSFDVCRSARKMGAKEVTLLSILPYDEMPAEEEEITEALEEGVQILDLTTLQKVIKGENGEVKTLVLQQMEKIDEDETGLGNIAPVQDVTRELEADNVIVAIGQTIDLEGFESLSSGGRLIALSEKESGKTFEEAIFAAGDAAYGPATAVKAIFQGRNCAKSICETIGGMEEVVQTERGEKISFSSYALQKTEKAKTANAPLEERELYKEISTTLNIEEILQEAERCLNCGCVAVSPTDVGTALIALDAMIVTNEREILAEHFFKAAVMGSTVLEKGEIVTNIRVPQAAAGNKQIYYKHRTRKSIDFPILSIALNADMDGQKVKDIRVVFGAAAPVPKRMHQVEEFLRGKDLTRQVAEEAAALAVEDCVPLAENAYKVHLLEVLTRRTLEKLI